MRYLNLLFQKRNWISLLLILGFLLPGFSQTTPAVFATVTLQKVEPGKDKEFLKMLSENWKPMHQVRKQSGKITNWRLYKVLFAGTNDEYNYVTVSYFDSWAKTEPNDDWPELLKKSNPKADQAIFARTTELRKIVRQSVYSRVDATAANNSPIKFVEIDFMKVKEGQGAEYVKVEKEVWKPLHQVLVTDGKRAGWGLWQLILPGGSQNTHDYVTSNIYSSYGQMAEGNYEEAFKKAHPGKDVTEALDRTGKTRSLVRSEVWELIDSTN